MHVHCQHCNHEFVVHRDDVGRGLRCPKCGIGITVMRQRTRRQGSRLGLPRSVKKIFEPIPKSLAYTVGLILVVAALSPFWQDTLQEFFNPHTVLINEDTPPLHAAPRSTPAPRRLAPKTELGEITLDHVGPLQLGATRLQVKQQYTLRQLNEPGMTPEIFEVSLAGNIERLTAHFYDSVLREFFLVYRAERAAPDDVEQRLVDQFGTANERSETSGSGGSGLIVNVSGLKPGDELAQLLEAFEHRRRLTWTDQTNRIEGIIFYDTGESQRSVSRLALRTSAVRWLEANGRNVAAPPKPETTAPIKPLSPQ